MKTIKFDILIILSILLLVFASGIFGANRVDELMNKGNKNYQNKNYEKALENYKSVLNEGFVSPALYYNIGNTYYRLGKLGKSILYFEKTLKLSPDDEDALYNLNIAKAHTKDRIKEVPQLFIVKWWNSFLTLLPASGWAAAVLIVYFILLLLIALWFFTRNSDVKQFSTLGGIAVVIVLIISITLLVSSTNHENSNKYGILLQSVTTAKASPDDDSSDAFVIHEGVKFSIEDQLQGWSEIKLADGKVGWIPQKSFGEI